MANVLDCSIVESEFELQLPYYVHFRTNTLGKGMKHFIPSFVVGQIALLLYFYKDHIGIK